MHTACMSSERLKEQVDKYVTKHSRTHLSAAIGVSESQLSRWLKNGVPNRNKAFRLALACGCSEEEAHEIAKEECPSEIGKEAG